MTRHKKKLAGDVGTPANDVTKEEFDEEGMPIIHMDEITPGPPAPLKVGVSVRVNAVKTRIPLKGGASRFAYQNEVITDPCPALLELADKDFQHRIFTIIKD